jgi:hypothetical protein
MVGFNKRHVQRARFLGKPRANAIPGMALHAGALLLPVDPVNRLNGGNREAKRSRKTERDCAQSQVPKWARRFFHLYQYIGLL